MKTFRVYVSYQVDCRARGYVDIEADNEEEAMDMAENGEGDIENTELEEYGMADSVCALDAEEC